MHSVVIGLSNKSDNVRDSTYDNVYYYAFLGDRIEAFSTFNQVAGESIGTSEDNLSNVSNTLTEIELHVILMEYKEATTKFARTIDLFPVGGFYEWLKYSPLLHNIRKEYPPIKQALDNLKIQSLVDVSDVFKY